MIPDVPAFLRPLVGAEFDTEVIPGASCVTELQMFTRPVGQSLAYEARPKDRCDTSMCNSGTIPTPVQFAICAFSLRPEGLDEEDVQQFNDGIFQFRYCGDRVYFMAPIGDMPKTLDTKKDWEGFLADPNPAQVAAEYFKQKDAPPLRAVIQGCPALMILSNEAFCVRLVWSKGLRLKKKATVRAGIWGIRYVPV